MAPATPQHTDSMQWVPRCPAVRETARDHTPMTALPYYHVAARAVPAITASHVAAIPQKKG